MPGRDRQLSRLGKREVNAMLSFGMKTLSGLPAISPTRGEKTCRTHSLQFGR